MTKIAIVVGGVAILAASASHAQVVGVGSTSSGALAQVTATISKVVSESGAGLQMRTQTMGGTQQYIPVVNAGELAFGVSNIAQYYMAQEGTGLSEGKKYPNLRIITTMMKFAVSFVVPNESGIKSVKDLKGKPLGYGFKASPLFQYIHAGGLASGGLTYDDVKKVPVVGLVQSWRAVMEGKTMGAIAAAGTGFVKQMNAKVKGGVRHISFPNTPEALKEMHKWFPKSEWQVIKPRKGLTGITEPTNFVAYDYLLWSHKGLSDEIAYKVAKIMHTKGKELKSAGPLWRSYETGARMTKDHGYMYHPGAIKYYKEAGLWKR